MGDRESIKQQEVVKLVDPDDQGVAVISPTDLELPRTGRLIGQAEQLRQQLQESYESNADRMHRLKEEQTITGRVLDAMIDGQKLIRKDLIVVGRNEGLLTEKVASTLTDTA